MFTAIACSKLTMFKDRRIRTSLIAIAADLFLTAIKIVLALITGSAALMADAYHSGTDLIVSIVLLGSLFIRFREESYKESRKESCAGKDEFRNESGTARKIESFLAVIVALIILYVPYEIVSELNQGNSDEIQHLWIGIVGVLIVIAIVHFMARLKTYVGRETDSPALEADGYHSKIDLFSTVAVLVSLIGTLVGIYLDEIVAVVIAVLIGIAGLELLVSGIRSLLRGDELDQISLLENFADTISRIPFSQYILNIYRQCVGFVTKVKWFVLPLLFIGWLLSGFTVVPLGYSGISERFGAPDELSLESGLHYVYPWPVDAVTLVKQGEVLSTTVGSRSVLPGTAKDAVKNNDSDQEDITSQDKLWNSIKASRVHNDETPYLATGDENLLDLELTLQYRISDPDRLHLHIRDVETIVTRFAENALWIETASHSFDDIFSQGYHEFSMNVGQQVVTALASIGVDIQLVDVQLQSIQPPAMVVPVYRDLINAFQEKQQRENRAHAQRIQDLLMANAERTTQKNRNSVELLENRLRAEGEAERFVLLAEVFDQHMHAMQFNQYIEALVDNLSDRTILITDPKVDKNDYRIWSGANSVMLQDKVK